MCQSLFNKCEDIYTCQHPLTLRPSLDASGVLHTTHFTGTGHNWEQIAISANPLMLIGANVVSRCPGLCCTVGHLRGPSAAAQWQATFLSHMKPEMKTCDTVSCISIQPPWTFPHFIVLPNGIQVDLNELFTIQSTENTQCFEGTKHNLFWHKQ